jgi:CelD/BcsL family acetyltransferase involved in cellulose biosynthesis
VPGAEGKVVDDVGALQAFHGAWDELAVRASRPFCAPGWLMPWWRHAAPAGARLRAVLVLDGDELIGVGPLYEERRGGLRWWRPLGAGACERVEPLAGTGREQEVAGAMARTIAEAKPDVVTFEGVPAPCPWPSMLATGWPGRRRPWLARRAGSTAPTVDLEGRDFDDWFKTRTGHFRQRARKIRKDFAAKGGTERLATEDTLERDLDSFARLHRARWEERGGSHALTPRVERMLRESGRELGLDRLRVLSLDVGDATIASGVAVAAGAELAYWLNGFDIAYAAVSPSRLGILSVIEDGVTLGARRVDLGEGDFEYKQRFADGEDALEWLWLAPPGPRQPLVRSLLAAARLRRAASERLPANARARLLGLVRKSQ